MAGCTVSPEPAPAREAASPFADCGALAAPPPSAAGAAGSASAGVSGSGSASAGVPAFAGSASAGVSGSGSASARAAGFAAAAPASGLARAQAAPGVALPALELPCFTGGRPVRLAELRGPAVINMWASWCEPCRAELPVMQRLADRAGGRLHVLGVDTGDGRDAAASFGAAKQIDMPTLYDQERKLLTAIGRINLPVTIFVDAAGRDYVHALPLDDPVELSALVRKHTGVAVAP
ncbi:MAG TPA: TlpA disulfide reductase family protein [Actinoplanes sp.]|nr:TlpA disulfide reductase family protein [Actinoplanes sp.]